MTREEALQRLGLDAGLVVCMPPRPTGRGPMGLQPRLSASMRSRFSIVVLPVPAYPCTQITRSVLDSAILTASSGPR